VFTARYALSPFVKQTCLVFQGLNDDALCVLHTLSISSSPFRAT